MKLRTLMLLLSLGSALNAMEAPSQSPASAMPHPKELRNLERGIISNFTKALGQVGGKNAPIVKNMGGHLDQLNNLSTYNYLKNDPLHRSFDNLRLLFLLSLSTNLLDHYIKLSNKLVDASHTLTQLLLPLLQSKDGEDKLTKEINDILDQINREHPHQMNLEHTQVIEEATARGWTLKHIKELLQAIRKEHKPVSGDTILTVMNEMDTQGVHGIKASENMNRLETLEIHRNKLSLDKLNHFQLSNQPGMMKECINKVCHWASFGRFGKPADQYKIETAESRKADLQKYGDQIFLKLKNHMPQPNHGGSLGYIYDWLNRAQAVSPYLDYIDTYLERALEKESQADSERLLVIMLELRHQDDEDFARRHEESSNSSESDYGNHFSHPHSADVNEGGEPDIISHQETGHIQHGPINGEEYESPRQPERSHESSAASANESNNDQLYGVGDQFAHGVPGKVY